LSAYLSSVGYLECRSPALETPEQADATAGDGRPSVKLKNPMSREYSALRTSLLPALVRAVERNARRGASSGRVYETDKVYRAPGEPERGKDLGATESIVLAAAAGGALNDRDWAGGTRTLDFHDVKGVVEDILELAGIHGALFEHGDLRGFTSESCAVVRAERGGPPIGYVGLIDQDVISVGKTPFKLFGFELDLATLLPTFDSPTAYKSLARTPAVERDLAFVVKVSDVFAEIERTLRESAGSSLESMRLVDIYHGKPIPAGHQSLAMRLVFRDPGRTLTADEVQAQVDRIVATMSDRFGATLRT
jgi:phenylalanyl-tRNA synthetase beta chain